MLTIARHQIALVLKDIRFIALLLITLVLFGANAYIFSTLYAEWMSDWREMVERNNEQLSDTTRSLQAVANFRQLMIAKPSPLIFISESGQKRIPNAAHVNAFEVNDVHSVSRANKKLWILPSIDWAFIVGTLLSIAALFFSFDAINGEKRNGTLKYMLANSISRLHVFIGKFLGLAIIIDVVLLAGVLLNLTFIMTLGDIPLSMSTLLYLGWPFLLSLLFINWIIALGMLVSSLTHRPSVALVLLLILWITMVEVVPGAARFIGDQLQPVRSEAQTSSELDDVLESVSTNQPEEAFIYPSDPFEDRVVLARKKYFDEMVDARNRYLRERTQEKVDQYHFVLAVSDLSPISLFSNTLAQINGTGIHGYSRFMEKAWEYKDQLYQFVVGADARDPDSPHRVYSFGSSSDYRTFSIKEVDNATVPRYTSLWPSGGSIGADLEPPYITIVIFIGLVLITLALAFISFARFDPR